MTGAARHAAVRPGHALLAHPPFVLFFIARCLAMLARQMVAVAVGWQMYALTGSALDLGFVGLAQFVPSFLLVLVAGHVADRFDRRRVVRICVIVEGAAALGLCVGSALGRIEPAMIYALVVVVGASRAFEMPTMQALLPAVVPESILARAIAANASAGQTAIIVGPALGGLLYVAGASVAYGASATLFLVTAIVLYFVKARHAPRPAQAPRLSSVLDGIRFIRGHKAVLGAISLDMFAVLLGGATALLPIYARDILHTGPWGLGLLRSATAVGALGMAIWLARHPLRAHAGRRMFEAVALFGIATIVFGVSRSFALSLVALIVLGAADMVSVVVRQSLVQLQTPDHMRGRVSAVNALFIGTSNQLGEFESGLTAAWLGVVPSVVAGGIGTLAIVVLWIRFFPALAATDRLDARAIDAERAAETPKPAR